MNFLIHFTTISYPLYNSIAVHLSKIYPGSRFAGTITAHGDVKGFLENQNEVAYEFLIDFNEVENRFLKEDIDYNELSKFEETLESKSLWRFMAMDMNWGYAFSKGCIPDKLPIDMPNEPNEILRIVSGYVKLYNTVLSDFNADVVLMIPGMPSASTPILEQVCKNKNITQLSPCATWIQNYFALNKSSSTEEVPVLVNGQELNLPITKSGKTSLGKEIIFLFNGYNRPDDLINHYSINDKVNLKIKDTDFEESFDVSSIKSVLEDTVRQCYIKANEYYSSLTTFEVEQPEFSSIKKVYHSKNKHIVVVSGPMHDTIWEYDPKTKAKKVINHVWNFGALAKKCDGIKPDNIYFAQTKDYYFMGGYSETSPFKIFDLESNVLGIAPSIKYAKNFCKFYEL